MAKRRILRWIAIVAILFTLVLTIWKGKPMLSILKNVWKKFITLFKRKKLHRIEPPTHDQNQLRPQSQFEITYQDLSYEREKLEKGFFTSPDEIYLKQLDDIEKQIDKILDVIENSLAIPLSEKMRLKDRHLHSLKNRLHTANFIFEKKPEKKILKEYADRLSAKIAEFEAKPVVGSKIQSAQLSAKSATRTPRVVPAQFRKSNSKGPLADAVHAPQRVAQAAAPNPSSSSSPSKGLLDDALAEEDDTSESATESKTKSDSESTSEQDVGEDHDEDLDSEAAQAAIPINPKPQKRKVPMKKILKWIVLILFCLFVLYGLWKLVVVVKDQIHNNFHWGPQTSTVTVVSSKEEATSLATSKPADEHSNPGKVGPQVATSQPSITLVAPAGNPPTQFGWVKIPPAIPEKPDALCAFYGQISGQDCLTRMRFGKNFYCLLTSSLGAGEILMAGNNDKNSSEMKLYSSVKYFTKPPNVIQKWVNGVPTENQISESNQTSAVMSGGLFVGPASLINEYGNREEIYCVRWMVLASTKEDNPPYTLPLPEDEAREKSRPTPPTRPSSSVPSTDPFASTAPATAPVAPVSPDSLQEVALPRDKDGNSYLYIGLGGVDFPLKAIIQKDGWLKRNASGNVIEFKAADGEHGPMTVMSAITSAIPISALDERIQKAHEQPTHKDWIIRR